MSSAANLLLQVPLHPLRISDSQFTVLTVVDEIGIDGRMCLAERHRIVEPHHHKRRGKSIGSHAILCHHRSGEDILLGRIARQRVDGVRIFLSVLIVEVTVVARRRHPDVRQFEHRLQILSHGERVVNRLVHSDAPQCIVRILPAHHYLAADVDHKILDTLRLKQLCHHIHRIAFRYGAAIEHHERIALLHAVAHQPDLPVSRQLAQTVHHCRIRERPLLESEPPCVDQRSNGDVETPLCLVGNLYRTVETGTEKRVHPDRFVAVHAADHRAVVEHRKREVEAPQLLLHFLLQVAVVLIGNVVYRPEHKPRQPVESGLLLMSDQNPDRCHNQQQQPQNVFR